jgi:hypothetical protein
VARSGVTEALAAADRLEQAGLSADVICVTSPGLLFQAWLAKATVRRDLDPRPSNP